MSTSHSLAASGSRMRDSPDFGPLRLRASARRLIDLRQLRRAFALAYTFKHYNFKAMNVGEMIPASARAADLMRSLSHPQRLLVLCALGRDEKSVADLRHELGGVDQVPMSQQLMRLRADGLVTSRREGTTVYYRIARPEVIEVVEALHAAFCRVEATSRRKASPYGKPRRSEGRG